MNEFLPDQIRNLPTETLAKGLRWRARRIAIQSYLNKINRVNSELGIIVGTRDQIKAENYLKLEFSLLKPSIEREVSTPTKRREQWTLNQILAKGQKTLIVGDAGAGKSTFLKYCAWITSQKKLPRALSQLKGCIPLLIRLREFKGKDIGIEDYVKNKLFSSLGLPQKHYKPELILDAISNGKGILLIDGLDEAGVINLDWVGFINQAANNGNTIIITSRPSSGRSNSFPNFTKLKIDTVSPELLDKFIKLHLPDRMEAKRFHAFLDPDFGIREFATTPFFLTLAIQQFKQGGKPYGKSRTQLIEEAIKRVLRLSSIGQSQLYQLELREIFREACLSLVTEFYLDLHERYQKSTLKQILTVDHREKDRTISVEQSLELLLAEAGVFQEYSDDTFEFRHRLFFEFYCAQYAAKEPQPEQLLEDHFFKDDFEEIIPLTIGVLGNSQSTERKLKALDLIKKIAEKKPDYADFLKQPELLVGICLGEADLTKGTENLQARVKNAVEWIYWNALDSDSTLLAAKVIVRCRNYSFTNDLRDQFCFDLRNQQNPIRRIQGARFLSLLEGSSSIPKKKLQEAVFNDSHWYVREAALEFLEELGLIYSLDSETIYRHLVGRTGLLDPSSMAEVLWLIDYSSMADAIMDLKFDIEIREDIVFGFPIELQNDISHIDLLLRAGNKDKELLNPILFIISEWRGDLDSRIFGKLFRQLLRGLNSGELIYWSIIMERIGLSVANIFDSKIGIGYSRIVKNLSAHDFKKMGSLKRCSTTMINVVVKEFSREPMDSSRRLGMLQLILKHHSDESLKQEIIQGVLKSETNSTILITAFYYSLKEYPDNSLKESVLRAFLQKEDHPLLTCSAIVKLMGIGAIKVEDFKLLRDNFQTLDCSQQVLALREMNILNDHSQECYKFAEKIFQDSDSWSVKDQALAVMGNYVIDEDRRRLGDKIIEMLKIQLESPFPQNLPDYRRFDEMLRPWAQYEIFDIEDPISTLLDELWDLTLEGL